MRTSIAFLTVFSIILLTPIFVSATEPLLYCKFDDTTTCEQGKTPISASGVSFETGKMNDGIRIDTSDILTYPSAGNFDKEKGTITMWVKTDWAGGDIFDMRYFFSYVDNGWATDAFRFRKGDTSPPISNDFIGLLYYESGGPDRGSVQYIDGTSWQAGQWYHIAATWDASVGHIKTYINGVKKEDYSAGLGTPFSLDPMINDEILIGIPYEYDFGPNDGNRLNGVMDELKIYDYALSDAEVMNEYLGPQEPPCNCSELQQRIESLEGNLTELKGRVGALEASITAIQSSISLLQEGLDTFRSLILGYISNAPDAAKKTMICGYMKDNNLTKYSALGLSCEIKGWPKGKPFLEWQYCKCK